MEFAYSLSMYSPPVRVRPANARRPSSTNTNGYNFVHGANKHNNNNHDQHHPGHSQNVEDSNTTANNQDKDQDNNYRRDDEAEEADHRHDRSQKQDQNPSKKAKKRKKGSDTSSVRSRIPGRRRPPPAGTLPQALAHRPASHTSHSRTSSSFSVGSRTSHETQAQAHSHALSQAQTHTHTHTHAHTHPQTQTQTQSLPTPNTQQLKSSSASTHAAATSTRSGTLLSSPPTSSISGTATVSQPRNGKGASAITPSASSPVISNSNFSYPSNTNTTNQTHNQTRDSTVASTTASAPPLAAAASASTSIASAPPSSSTTLPASDPERPPSSPKPSKFIRSVHIPIFSTDSGFHHQQHHTPAHSTNKLQKRDSLHYQVSTSDHNTQRPQTPSSPIKPVAGLSSPIRRRSSRGKNHHDAMPPEPSQFVILSNSVPISFRTGSFSSPSGSSNYHRTGNMSAQDHFIASSTEGSVAPSSASTSTKPSSTISAKPFVIRNNRTYINEPTLLYPLPVDLAELHRQSLRTLMLFQVFGGPTTAPEFSNKPPSSVLEVGCGSAFWSMMCHRYFAQHGHSSISFTGLDIVPLVGTGLDQNWKPDKDMKWRFVQHDMRRTPWPLPDNEFDLIMVKDMTMCLSTFMRDPNTLFEEYLRMLKPGGVLEFWESDHSIRMLRPHVTKPSVMPAPDSDSDSDDSSEDEGSVAKLGAYVMTNNTPLSAPLNPFLVEYNSWVTKGLDALGVSAVPCTLIGPYLLQEAETLMELRSKRLAIPLSEIRWEREGVGGVVTKDGKSYIDSMKRKGKSADSKGGGKGLTASQAALRRTALETVVGMIQALEPVLRDASGKSQDEWDNWSGKMMNDLLREGGTSWGECLEVGAWSARKKLSSSTS